MTRYQIFIENSDGSLTSLGHGMQSSKAQVLFDSVEMALAAIESAGLPSHTHVIVPINKWERYYLEETRSRKVQLLKQLVGKPLGGP